MKNTCPGCKSEKCYISFLNVVECSNKTCKYYSSSLYPPEDLPVPKDATPAQTSLSFEEDDSEHKTPMYFWSNYHTDCGD